MAQEDRGQWKTGLNSIANLAAAGFLVRRDDRLRPRLLRPKGLGWRTAVLWRFGSWLKLASKFWKGRRQV